MPMNRVFEGAELILLGVGFYWQLRGRGEETQARVANVVWDSNTLLTNERYIKMKNWFTNIFLIQTTSNYFWASEV